MRYFLLISMILLVSLSASGDVKGLDACSISFPQKKSNLRVEIARTFEERTLGLMFRKSMDENHGMLFIYEEEDYLSFWMKNTYLPLDIAFIDSTGAIVSIQHMTPLDTGPRYRAPVPVRFALEVNQGWFIKHRIAVGDKVVFHGCLGQ